MCACMSCLRFVRVAQVVNRCMLTFVAVQAGVIWIHQILFVYLIVAGHLGDFQWGLFEKDLLIIRFVRSLVDFFFFLKNACLCEARKKNILLFESRSGILLGDQDLDWESEKPKAASQTSPRGCQLPKCPKVMGTSLPRDVWTNSSILLTPLLLMSVDQAVKSLALSNSSSCFEENESTLGTFLPK